MQILRIENGQGFYNTEIAEMKWLPIDGINKDDLLKLVNISLQNDVMMDPFNTEILENQAQQIIYKSIFGKLSDLITQKKAFKDESDRKFYEQMEKYSQIA